MSFAPLRSLPLFFASLALVACLDKPYDPDGPGEFIGTFAVDAKIDTNTCGDGALDAPPSWTFEVRLSRDIDLVLWNNGSEYISGKLSADKRTFSFDTMILINMRDANSAPWLPPCTMERWDRSDGVLAEDDASFKGKLSYDFTPQAGSNCDDLVTEAPPVFAKLPCAMTYTLDAKRTSTSP